MSAKSGQVAVILILVIAAGLIFYAISLNFGRISQVKTVTTMAADTGASTLASYIASSGQAIFETSLGGNQNKCGLTGVVVAIATVIIVVVSGGSLAAIALALMTLFLQAAVVQPGLSDAWNEKAKHGLAGRDSFLEQGIQKALGTVATDRAVIADLDDDDQDRVFGLDALNEPRDTVSRFGVYYIKQRINSIPPPPATLDFQADLRDFLYINVPGDWGISDDPDAAGPRCDPFSLSSECNPCCVPNIEDVFGKPVRPPEICGEPTIFGAPNPAYDEGAIRTWCEDHSPYGVNYPWVYDAYRGNPVNALVSFQEQLGRDDEHKGFEKSAADPGGPQVTAAPPPTPPDVFQLEDTTGYYAADNREGVFGFFYKIADWGVNLDPAALVTNNPANPQCHWCSAQAGTMCAPTPPHPVQLVLPLGSPPSGAVYNTTLCVDGVDPVGGPSSGNPPLAVDLVRLPDLTDVIWTLGYNGGVNDAIIPLIGKIEADVDQCAQSAPGRPETGFWKRGGDRFCSAGGDAWTYYGNCPAKYGASCVTDGTGCLSCVEPATAPVWPDDLLDDVVYGLNWFMDWAREFLNMAPESFTQEFQALYPQVGNWIEPASASATKDPNCALNSALSPAGASCCYLCPATDGPLVRWYKEIKEMKDRLRAWRDTSFAGSQCREVWCVPPADYSSCSPEWFPPSAPEEATFDSNPLTPRGDMAEIVACINWNANDPLTYSDGTPATGNADKFQACAAACASAQKNLVVEKCSNLPRSLVPFVDTRIPDQNDLRQLERCRNSCSNARCQPMNPSYFTGIGNPALTDFEASTAGPPPVPSICSTWGAGNAWYDRIMVTLAELCDPVAGGWLDGIVKSIPEAQNQVAKFRHRHLFLSGRLAELDQAILVLDTAEDQFRRFLTCEDGDSDGFPDGAACRLIKARIDFDNQEHGLPYHAIYGWQDEPGKDGTPGKWHIARVDARIPERCDNDCNIGQLPGDSDIDGDPPWPWVRTDDEGFLNSRRCFEIDGTDGIVKVRVTRFDETGGSSMILFPNAVEIWKPTFGRSDRPETGGSSPDAIEGACVQNMLRDPCSGPGQCPPAFPGSLYYGAFMMNKRVVPGSCDIPGSACAVCNTACEAACDTQPDPDLCKLTCPKSCTPIDNIACWDLANRLLARGVTSEACAQYYFHGEDRQPAGMDFKFIRCPNF